LATTGPASRDDSSSRYEYRADRESIRDRSPEREAERDRGAVDIGAAICDRSSIGDSSTIRDARAERNSIDHTRADSRTRGRGAAALRERIEDGEPLDSDSYVDVRRCADPIAVTERSTTTVDVTGSIAVRDTRPIAVTIRDTIAGTQRIADAERISRSDAIAGAKHVTRAEPIDVTERESFPERIA